MRDIDNAAKWNQKIYPNNDSASLMGLYLEMVLESMCKLNSGRLFSKKMTENEYALFIKCEKSC